MPTKKYTDERKKSATEYDVWTYIHKGCYPELYEKERDWAKYYSNYIKTYIERDVSKLIRVGDGIKFYKFMEVLAARISTMLNVDSVCGEIGINHKTAEEWLSMLQKANIIYLLRPYYNNLTSRAIKTPKLYFLDTGLAAYLTHWDTKATLKTGAKSGDFFENFVICEILKSYYNTGLEPNNLYYYRDKNKNEIDLLIEQGDTVYPVEIKSNSNPSKGDVKAFAVLAKALKGTKKLGEGAVVCAADGIWNIKEEVVTIPYYFI
jgi:predicted AAA+ superfamily ATPase